MLKVTGRNLPCRSASSTYPPWINENLASFDGFLDSAGVDDINCWNSITYAPVHSVSLGRQCNERWIKMMSIILTFTSYTKYTEYTLQVGSGEGQMKRTLSLPRNGRLVPLPTLLSKFIKKWVFKFNLTATISRF